MDTISRQKCHGYGFIVRGLIKTAFSFLEPLSFNSFLKRSRIAIPIEISRGGRTHTVQRWKWIGQYSRYDYVHFHSAVLSLSILIAACSCLLSTCFCVFLLVRWPSVGANKSSSSPTKNSIVTFFVFGRSGDGLRNALSTTLSTFGQSNQCCGIGGRFLCNFSSINATNSGDRCPRASRSRQTSSRSSHIDLCTLGSHS